MSNGSIAGIHAGVVQLNEGPLFFASFTGSRKEPEYMPIIDETEKKRN